MPEKEPHENDLSIAMRLFKRISQIYGVPLKELLPVDYRLPLEFVGPLRAAGQYSQFFHSIKLLRAPASSQDAQAVLAHELSHAAAWLMSPVVPNREMELVSHFAKNEKFSERIRKRYLAAFIRARREHSKWTHALSLNEGMGAVFHPDVGFEHAKCDIIARHGADGLLLLYATYPRISSVSSYPLRKWEQNMVEAGCLKERAGGLTHKGISFLKEIHPRSAILCRTRFTANLRLALEYSRILPRIPKPVFGSVAEIISGLKKKPRAEIRKKPKARRRPV